MIRPLDALASAVELALRNTQSRLYMLPLKAPDDVRAPLEAEKRVYENALALARGEEAAPAVAADPSLDTLGWEVGDRCLVPWVGDRGEITSFSEGPEGVRAHVSCDVENGAVVPVSDLEILYDEPDAARPW